MSLHPSQLPSFNFDDQFMYGTAAVVKTNPNVASQVAMQIAIATSIDDARTHLLSTLAAADVRMIAGVMAAIPTAAGKRKAVIEAASMLRPGDMELLRSVINLTATVDETRNMFAHWIWLHCLERPLELGLIQPKDVQIPRASSDQLKTLIARGDIAAGLRFGALSVNAISHKHTRVVTEDAAKAFVVAALRTYNAVRKLTRYLEAVAGTGLLNPGTAEDEAKAAAARDAAKAELLAAVNEVALLAQSGAASSAPAKP